MFGIATSAQINQSPSCLNLMSVCIHTSTSFVERYYIFVLFYYFLVSSQKTYMYKNKHSSAQNNLECSNAHALNRKTFHSVCADILHDSIYSEEELVDVGDCVFPFTYKGVEYTQCTGVGALYGTWCATTDDFENNPDKWIRC